MKKKIWKTSGIALLVILLSAATSIGLFQLIKANKDAIVTNVLGIDWYNEDEKEFTLTTAEELREFAKLSKFYDFDRQTVKLGADIILNEGNAEEWKNKAPKNKWVPIEGFAGTFDGQNHTISGLYAKAHEIKMALFVDTNASCRIQNTKLVNSYFEMSGHSGVASFVSNGGGRFSGLYSDAIFNIKGENVGGIGSVINKQAVFEECWFDGTITTTLRECGGIIDSVEGARAEVKHCLFSGSIYHSLTFAGNDTYGGTMTGGLVGRVNKTATLVMNDCLSSGKVECALAKFSGGVVGVTFSGSQNTFRNVYMSTDTYKKAVGTQNGTNDGKPMAMRQSELIGVKAYQWTELDFNKYWTVTEEDTPILSRFAETKINLDGIEKAYDMDWYKPDLLQFEISNLKQLYGFCMISYYDNFNNKTIKLSQDIVVNEGTPAKWLKNGSQNPWYAISNFAGIFDGQGHTISGIYHITGEDYQGFFGQTKDIAIIKNFNLKNSYFESKRPSELSALGSIAGELRGKMENVYSNAIVISHGTQSGGMVGRANDNDSNGMKDEVRILNCWFDGEFHLKGEKTQDGGGIVGRLVQGDLLIEHCLNTGLVTSEANGLGLYFGGFVGAVRNAKSSFTVRDSLNAGKLETLTASCAGSILGRATSTQVITIENTYATKESFGKTIGSAPTAKITGGAIRLGESWLTGYNAYKWTELDFPNYWAIVKNSTPVLQYFTNSDPSIAGIEKAIDTSWYKPNAKVMVIDSVKKLYGFAMLAATTNFEGQTVKLGKDIVINPVNEAILASWVDGTVTPEYTWLPIGDTTKPFAGTFDGQGHTVSGMYLNTNETYNGMFGYTADTCMIKNFRLVDSCFINTLTTMNAFGSVAGELRGDMDGVYSNAIVIANGNQAGGMIGRVNDPDSDNKKDEVIITNCWFDGEFYHKGEKCQDGGGIAGRLMQGNLLMEHCLNTGLVSSEAHGVGLYVGGLVGAVRSEKTTFTVRDSLNTGKLETLTTSCVGSILGRASSAQVITVKNTYATKESCGKTIGSAPSAKITGNVLSLEEKCFVGENAYRFTWLDYDKYWTVVEGNAPIPQKFATNIIGTDKLAHLVNTTWFNSKVKKHHIDTVEELYGFVKLSIGGNTFKGHTIYLDANLDVNAVEEGTIESWIAETVTPKLLWVPIGTTTYAFEGTFHGQGHTISGLYVQTSSRYAGMFGYIKNAKIKNLRLVDSLFQSKNTGTASIASIVGGGSGTISTIYSNATLHSTGVQVGGIVANAGGMKLDNCWYDGDATLVYSTGTNSAQFGGIVGVGSTTTNTLEKCLFTGTMDFDYYGTNKTQGTSSPWIGGIAGGDGKQVMKIINSISVGDISMVWYKKATANTAKSNKFINIDDVLGYKGNTDTEFRNKVYSATVANWQIEETGTKNSVSGDMSKLDLSDVNAYYITLLDFKKDWILRQDKITIPKALALKNEEMSLANVIEPDAEWFAEEAKDLYIDTVEELYGLMSLSLQGETFAGQTIHLEKSIDINKVTSNTVASWKAGEKAKNIWIPIGTAANKFEGTFDGHGNSIRGLYLKTGSRYAGLFGYVKDATIQNVRLEDSYLESVTTGTATLGSLIGAGSGSLLHSYSNAIVVSTGNEVGGLVAKAEGMTVNGCWYAGTLTMTRTTNTASAYYGGIVGTGATTTNTINNTLYTGILEMNYTSTNPTQGSWGSCIGGIAGYDGNAPLIIKNTIGAGTMTLIWNKDANGSTAPNKIVYTTDVLGYSKHADTTATENIYSATTGTMYVEAKDTTTPIQGSTNIDSLEDSKGFYGTALDFNDMWVARTDAVPAPRRLVTSGQITGLKKADTSWFNPEDIQQEYILDNENKLMGLATLVNGGQKFTNVTIKLGKDMVLNETDADILDAWKAGTATPQFVWTPIGKSTTYYFDGIFDGCNHTISGLYTTSSNYVSLFGAAGSNSQIKNVAITDSVFRATGDYVAGVVGFFWGTNIENVYSDASLVMLGSNSKENGFGGIVGRLRVWDYDITKTIKKCWYAGDIIIEQKLYTRIGGIVGDVFGDYTGFTLKMENCLFSGTMTVKAGAEIDGMGGIIGVNGNNMNHTFVLKNCVNSGVINDLAGYTNKIGLLASSMSATATGNSITNCYVVYDGKHKVLSETPFGKENAWTERDAALANVKVEESALLAKKDADLTALFGEGAGDVWQSYVNARGTAKGAPILKQFAKIWIAKQSLVKIPDTSWFDANDEKKEYTLLDEEELMGLATLVNGGQKFTGITIKLGKDMVLNETSDDILAGWKDGTKTPRNIWTPIGKNTTYYFDGIFDGCNHTISGLYTSSSNYTSLFGAAGTNSQIKNVAITDSVFRATGDYLAGVVGFFWGTNIENVYSDVALIMLGSNAKESCFGGIVGRLRVWDYDITKTFKKCWYAGDITMENKTFSRIGGIIGDIMGNYTGFTLKMENCLFSGTMTIKAGAVVESLGGIIGVNGNDMNHTFVLKNCVNSGVINDLANNTNAIGLLASSMSATATGNSITNCYVVGDGRHDVISKTPFGMENAWTGRDAALANVKVAKDVLLATDEDGLTALFGEGASDVWQPNVNEQGIAIGTPVLKQFALINSKK